MSKIEVLRHVKILLYTHPDGSTFYAEADLPDNLSDKDMEAAKKQIKEKTLAMIKNGQVEGFHHAQ